MKKLTILLAALMVGCTACEAQEKKQRPMDNDAVQFAMSMGIGWNLGNQMDAHYGSYSCDMDGAYRTGSYLYD